MKNIAFVFILFLSIIPQFLLAQEWHNSLSEAQEEAKKSSKNILLVFCGSDWCAPCIKMEQKIWNSTDFISYSEKNMVLLKADFPRRKKNALDVKQQEHNEQLAERFNSQGIFPFVVLMDVDGKVLAETGYEKLDGKGYVTHLQNLVSL